MIANGGNHRCHLVGRHAHVIQYTHRHECAGLCMVVTVDNIANVVHIACNPRNFKVFLAVIELLQNFSRHRCHVGHVGKAVLGKAHPHQGAVRFFNIGADGGIVFHIFKFNFQ